MPEEGVEPSCLAALDLKSSASASSATPAHIYKILRRRGESNSRIVLLQRTALPLGYDAFYKVFYLFFNNFSILNSASTFLSRINFTSGILCLPILSAKNFLASLCNKLSSPKTSL